MLVLRTGRETASVHQQASVCKPSGYERAGPWNTLLPYQKACSGSLSNLEPLQKEIQPP